MTLMILCAVWVIAAAGVAILPMRLQYVPGAALLLVSPVLIAAVAGSIGPVWSIVAALAVISMFRKPLRYWAHRLLERISGSSA